MPCDKHTCRESTPRTKLTSLLVHVMDAVLVSLGFNARLLEAATPLLGPGRIVARITNEDRLGYRLESARGELRGVLTGKARRAAAQGDALRPSVGDWVIVEDREGPKPGATPLRGDGLPILDVVPRISKLSRKAAGRDAVEQVVGANIDVAFLVTAIDGDLNPRRLERYRTVCEDGGVRPIVVLTKIDLVPDHAPAIALVEHAMPGVTYHLTSPTTGVGLEALDAELSPGLTIALLGSSGVGKSTIANRWLAEQQATGEVDDFGRGRHTTTARSIFRTRSGALLMDTPGMRELSLWEADEGLAATFADVEAVAARCKFSDCAHEGEPGCALDEALARGEVARDRVESWKKLRGEIADNERRRDARLGADDRKNVRTLQRALRARLRQKGR
jgi:ribosome biogenesis GTPase / thiamine phosphate phosphatase